MADAEDKPQKYGVWDTKEKSWVRNKEYDSLRGASRAVDRLDNQYGGYRYVTKELPAPAADSGSTPRSGGGGGAGAMVRGQDTIQHSLNPLKLAKGGSASKRGDGIAQRGKTRGKMI